MSVYPGRDLSRMNTLGVPARADHFVAAASVAEVQRACQWAREQRQAVRVLGEGSNTLAAERVAALVLQPAIKGICTLEVTGDAEILEIGAGENWHQLVVHTLDRGLYGLENLSLIPGSVGAAPVQNIGAYGVELSQIFHSLRAVDITTGAEELFDHERCAFGYRDSVFKGPLRGRYVITHVRLKLSRTGKLNLSYPALVDALPGRTGENLTATEVSQAVCRVRQQKLPDPEAIPNCGSFFKNPVVSAEHSHRLREEYPDMAAFPQADGSFKLAAGWLIERAGWKGKCYGGIIVHSQQALVLTNPQRLPASAVLEAAGAIQTDVTTHFGVQLEIEPQVLGDF